MIPFGVWWWAQHPPIAVGTTGSPEAQAAVSAKAKQGKQAIVKKKPFRPAAIAPLPRIVPKVEDAEVRNEIGIVPAVVPETLPAPVALATEVLAPDATNPQQPKKGVLKTIVSPFQKLKSKAKITGIEE